MAGRCIGAAVLMAMLSLFAVPRPEDAATMTARQLAAHLVVLPETQSTTYSSTYFRHWTRTAVPLAESRVPPTFSTRCTVARGRWVSWYDGANWTIASDDRP